MKTVHALIAAGITFAVVAVREQQYRSAHPYAHGVSGELIALGVAGAVACIALAVHVYQRNERLTASEQMLWEQIRALQAEIHGLTLDDLLEEAELLEAPPLAQPEP